MVPWKFGLASYFGSSVGHVGGIMSRNIVLEAYYRGNYDQLIKSARRRVGNYSLHCAEDAVQEAFLRACRYWRTYDTAEDIDKWFRKILRNCINQIKNESRNNGVVYRDDVEPVSSDNHEIVFTQEIESLMVHASQRDQEILNMRFFLGYKTIEISKVLQISHDVVRDVIRRFKIRVRE